MLVLLLVGGFVTFLVLNATKKSGPAAEPATMRRASGGDATPLGDTTEHAGEQTEEGHDPARPRAGRERQPDPAAPSARPARARAASGSAATASEPAAPASERLADRDV